MGGPSTSVKRLRATKNTFDFSIKDTTYYIGSCDVIGEFWIAFVKPVTPSDNTSAAEQCEAQVNEMVSQSMTCASTRR